KSTRTTKINAPTFTSGRKYSMEAPRSPFKPSPSRRGRLQAQNILLVLLLRHAQRDGTIGGTSDELLHQWIGRLPDLVWRTGRHNTATMQHDHFIRNTKSTLHVVRDDHAGNVHLVGEVDHEFIDDPRDNRIKAGRGLIVEDNFGVKGDGARQTHALLHATTDF